MLSRLCKGANGLQVVACVLATLANYCKGYDAFFAAPSCPWGPLDRGAVPWIGASPRTWLALGG